MIDILGLIINSIDLNLPEYPAWIANHIPNKVLDEIAYPFPNLNGATVEV